MSSDCIFCKIVRGEIPCAKVYETDTILAFLDIAPVAFGHTLVIPKEHHDTFFDVPVSLCRDLHTALQKVGQGMMQSTKAEGMNLGNERVAGGRAGGFSCALSSYSAFQGRRTHAVAPKIL